MPDSGPASSSAISSRLACGRRWRSINNNPLVSRGPAPSHCAHGRALFRPGKGKPASGASLYIDAGAKSKLGRAFVRRVPVGQITPTIRILRIRASQCPHGSNSNPKVAHVVTLLNLCWGNNVWLWCACTPANSSGTAILVVQRHTGQEWIFRMSRPRKDSFCSIHMHVL